METLLRPVHRNLEIENPVRGRELVSKTLRTTNAVHLEIENPERGREPEVRLILGDMVPDLEIEDPERGRELSLFRAR